MLKPMIAVFDKKTSLYDSPMLSRHTGESIREFERISKDPATKFGQHQGDFELHQIGTFDEETGTLNSQITVLHSGHPLQ